MHSQRSAHWTSQYFPGPIRVAHLTARSLPTLPPPGALLSSAIKEREERIRAFALRVRAAGSRLAAGRTMARRFRTEDVVNDAPLPQFKLELATLTQLLAPRRPLKRSKKLVRGKGGGPEGRAGRVRRRHRFIAGGL